MPYRLRIGPYSIGFYAADGTEPPHVHVRRDRQLAKIWLEPAVSLAANRGFADHEMRRILIIVNANRTLLLRLWHEYFGQ